jgi:hypothetical protein
MRRVMVLVLVALGCVLLTEAPAQACDRASVPFNRAVQRSDVVFSGTVTDRSTGGDRTSYAVTVDRVWQGRVPEEATVVSPRTRADCALTGIRPDDKVLFVASEGSGDTFSARSFEGTRSLTAKVTAAVVKRLGKGGQPIAAAPDPADQPLEMTVVDDSEPAGFGTLALPGGILVALGLLTLLLAQLLGRRPARS